MEVNNKREGENHLRLPRLISDGMVLQRDTKIKIWGWAPVGEEIKIKFLDREYSAVSNVDGKWKLVIPAQKAGGSYEMVIRSKNSTITLKDILIGDVWVCSGQSNMELPVERVKDRYQDEIENVDNDDIRQFKVEQCYDFNKPRQDFESGNWQTANQENIEQFSAAAYFFAKELYEKYKIPLGLINAAVGGSPVESWLSEDVLRMYPDHLKTAAKYKDNKYIEKILKEDEAKINSWYNNLENRDKGLSNDEAPWYNPEVDTSNWFKMQIPTSFNQEGLKNFKGSIWFRKEVDIPASMTGKPGRLCMGRIVDSDTAYINGQKVGNVEYQYPPRKYDFSESLLKEGKNTIVLRVVCNNGEGAFIKDKPYKLKVENQVIDLKGTWKYKVGAEVSEPAPEETFIEWKPMGLFNGMISPLINYTIKGVIWYQGESNTSAPEEYRKTFPALIKDWRLKWNQGKFPFLYVQLPNYGPADSKPSESEWAEFREAQLEALKLPNTAVAVAIDLGEWNDLHPVNKKDIGKRLALAAQYKAYGDEDIIHSGPVYKSAVIIDNRVIITFKNIGSGLVAKGSSTVGGIAIAGSDKKFIWAQAKIEDEKVVVWNDKITSPAYVRYAWADNPEKANLYNKEGLPAVPFRIDSL